MAAEAILGIIAQKAAELAAKKLIKESSRLSQVKEDLLWIETEMRRIQSYLEDAEAMQPKTKRVSNFIKDMWDLAYDVEDIIDTYFPKMRSSRSRLKGLLGRSNLTTARRFAKDVEGIKKRVDDITKARETFKIDESSRTREADTWDPRRTYPHVDEPNVVVGFDDLIKDLEQKVLDGDLHHRMVSIIGNAGLGKTTLARKVYNSVRQHFGCSAWICVSQQPNYKDLFRDVARQVGMEKEKMEQDVEANLFAFLNGKRYAIVIDDIWHTKAWDALKVGLPANSEDGSRIILTSQITDVGVHAGGVNSVLELQPLDPETNATTNCNASLKFRRVAIHGGDIGHYISLNPETSRVRAMLCFLRETQWNRSVTKNLLSNSKFLRVLRIDDDYIPRTSLLTEICNLRQLTYLKLSSESLASVELPYAISYLKSLLTLDLQKSCCVNLPDIIWNMKQLRHILLPERCSHLPIRPRVNCLNLSHPVEFSLTNLQTLYGLPSNLFKADWLHNLTNLRTLLVYYPTKDIMEVLILDVTPVSQKLETLRLHYFFEKLETNSVNLSRYENLHTDSSSMD
ncbi:hypothetical protein RHSIM_Rhsim03G0242600 [Rhododendron simsii]|uniref:AAA+ ATPase domain-containing protein n=1 Tax=Rhododendron simsii TaxID=118357 RepID=A0A834H4S4_RHOSS|nr:hypothetical protein RHSIM_Rhsim03G0242600 [Rhododendron simsii]